MKKFSFFNEKYTIEKIIILITINNTDGFLIKKIKYEK